MAATIRIEFVDAASGRPVGRTDVPRKDLPSGFGRQESVEIEGRPYAIERCEPSEIDDLASLKSVRLFVRPIRPVDPADILCSLPTICDPIPPVVRTACGPRVLRLHEDDWRQVELVARAHEHQVDVCLGQIRRIHRDFRKGPGFTQLHVRSEVPLPLGGLRLELAQVRPPGARAFDGLSYLDADGIIAAGFAFETASGLAVYGETAEGALTAFGLHGAVAAEDAKCLAGLAGAHGLLLVDWCRAVKRAAGEIAAG